MERKLKEEDIGSKIESDKEQNDMRLEKIFKKSFILKEEMRKSRNKKREDSENDIIDFMINSEKMKKQKEIYENSSFFSLNFWKFHVSRNTDMLSNLFLDMNLLLLTFPLNTIKTRIQSKHKYEDVSYFLKNNVDKQSLYSGISQGFISCAIGTIANISILRLTNIYLKENKYTSDYNPFTIKMISHFCADLITTPLRLPFEVSKQLSQINYGNYSLTSFFMKMRKSLMPSLFRDILFRMSYNICFYLVVFRKYYYYKLFENPLNDNYNFDLNSLARVSYNDQYTAIIASVLISLSITNPLDVVATKLVTQQYEKYTGFFNCLKTIYKEEGLGKLFFSGYSARTCFYLVNTTFFFHFYDKIRVLMDEAYSI